MIFSRLLFTTDGSLAVTYHSIRDSDCRPKHRDETNSQK